MAKQFFILVVVFLGLSYADILMPYFISTSIAFEHYEKYEINQASSIGVFHFFRYGFIFLLMAYWHKLKDTRLFVLTLCWGIVGFATTRIGVGIFGRLHFIFFPFFAFMPSFLVNKRKYDKNPAYDFLIFGLVVFYLVNFYVSVQETLAASSAAEMTNYHLFNPFNPSGI